MAAHRIFPVAFGVIHCRMRASLSLPHAGFSLVAACGLLSRCGVRASLSLRRAGFSLVAVCGLSCLAKRVILVPQVKVKVLVAQSCPTLQPNRLEPARLLCPWTPPGKNTGDWSGLPFPSAGDLPDPGIEPKSPVSQATISPTTRDQTCIPCIGRQILNHWTARGVPPVVMPF